MEKGEPKTRLLDALCRAPAIAKAVKDSGIGPRALMRLLETDSAFRQEFDEIVNYHLEWAAIDSALGGNATLSTLLLINRLPRRYKHRQVRQSEQEAGGLRPIFLRETRGEGA